MLCKINETFTGLVVAWVRTGWRLQKDSCWGDGNRNGWCMYSLGKGSADSNCCVCFHIYRLKQNAWVQSTNCCTNVLGGGYVLFCSSEVTRSGSGLTHEPGFVTHRLQGWPHHDLWRTGWVSVQIWRWHFQHIARSYSQLIFQIGKNVFFFTWFPLHIFVCSPLWLMGYFYKHLRGKVATSSCRDFVEGHCRVLETDL